MKTIFDWFGKFGKDKWMHFGTGVGLFAVTRFAMLMFWPGYVHVAVAAFSIVLLTGFVKEYVYDKWNGGTVDIWDAFATSFGGAVGWTCGLVI